VLPGVTGFAVRVGRGGDPVGPPPGGARLAALGQRRRFELEAGPLAWSGVALLGAPGGEPASTPGGGPAVPPGAGPVAGPGTGWPVARANRAALLFAGELYNHDELAAALGEDAAAGADDADLVLACWLRYGVATFRLLNGRYAAILSDGPVLVAATDHAGGVPLHVRTSAPGSARPWVQAATEAKALAAGDPGAGPAPRRVAAGTALVVDLVSRDARWRVVRTWAPPLARRIVPPDDAVAAVRDRLERAVRTRAAGEPTVVISGGIDSGVVAAVTVAARGSVRTVSLGTDVADEFDAARAVAAHLGTAHRELTVPAEQLVGELPWAVWAAECSDPDVLEYLLPLVALYRRLDGGPLRILTGYGADIPLGGMHRRAQRLGALDEAIAADMNSFDGLGEMAPALSGVAGHWSTHPFWDRDVLDLLVALEPGLKRRAGQDKWVLREAFADLLPAVTVRRAKLGIHEGSAVTGTWSRLLRAAGVRARDVPAAKQAAARRLYERLVLGDARPDEITLDAVVGRDATVRPGRPA